MNPNLYKKFYELQKKHWWFVTRKSIVLDAIRQHTNHKANDNILDIGCGSGFMLNALSELGNTYGMDMSEDAIKYSKIIYDGDVKKGSLPYDTPYDAKYFDLITALDVIEHIEDDCESLRTIHSLLKDQGKLVITVPAYMFLWSSHDDVNHHKRRYTLNELKTKLQQAGFIIENISYYNSILFPLIYLTRKMNNLLNKQDESDVALPGKYLNKLFKLIFGLEKYLLRFIKLPFGVSIIAVVKKQDIYEEITTPVNQQR